jgi:hypothetical protein
LYSAFQRQAVCVVQQFLDAYFCDSAVQKIADVGLVFVKDIDELPLRKAAPVDLGEDSFDNRGLHLERRSLRTGESEVVENVALCDVRRFAHILDHSLCLTRVWLSVFESLHSLQHPAQPGLRCLNISPISFSAVLLEAVKHINDIVDSREVHNPVPGAFIAFFQFPDTLPNF